MTSATETLKTAEEHAKYYEGKRAELAATIAENDTSVAQLRQAVTLARGAKRVCPREKAEAYLDPALEGKEPPSPSCRSCTTRHGAWPRRSRGWVGPKTACSAS